MFKTAKDIKTSERLEAINQKFINFQNQTKQAPDVMPVVMPKGPYNSEVGGAKMKKDKMDKMEGGFAWLPLVMSLVVPAIIPVVSKIVENLVGSGKMNLNDLAKLKGGMMEGEAKYMKGGSDYLGMAKPERKKPGRKSKMNGTGLLLNRPTTDAMPSSSMSGGCCDSDAVIVVGGAKRSQSNKIAKRGQLIKKLMKENKMTLPEASKYIKENNLL